MLLAHICARTLTPWLCLCKKPNSWAPFSRHCAMGFTLSLRLSVWVSCADAIGGKSIACTCSSPPSRCSSQ
ncbi:hypothetical protein C8Q72DRAFT_227566 [Fomitopsis betulina]|nr:hypothetical protein C8Q72DRAFT_227566 [Fomitopsis betulina]